MNAQQLDLRVRNCEHNVAAMPCQIGMKIAPIVLAVLFVMATLRASEAHYPWKRGIVTTVFWIGERPTANNPVPNYKSSWDLRWAKNYGGLDNPDPSQRRNYIPVRFIPRQNPFYVALPYNDVTRGTTKPEARRAIPWFKQAFETAREKCAQRSLGCHQTGQQNLLCAVGGLWSFPHRPLAVCVRQPEAASQSEPGRGTGCFSRSARLSWDAWQGRHRLEIRRGARCSGRSMDEVWG